MIPQLSTPPQLGPKVARWLKDLRQSGFEGDIDTRFSARLTAASDNSVYEILPEAIVFPRSAGDVVKIMLTLNHPEARSIQIVPRWGGTGTNGQSLNEGVVIDLSRHMRSIGPVTAEFDAVHVEPGVVLDDLNRAMAPHGRFFPPTLSPSDRATLGGMISTNACGKGSRVYGRTLDHILELDVVLTDGTRTQVTEVDIAQARKAAQHNDLLGAIYRSVLGVVEGNRDTIEASWPQMPRSPSGYNLRQALSADGSRFSLVPIVCGSEGTLAVIVGAKLKLTAIPKHKRMVVFRYSQFDHALTSAEVLVRANPEAIETIDENILKLVRTDILWHRVSHLLNDDGNTRAMNIIEFVGDDAAVLDAKVQQLIQSVEGVNAGQAAPMGHFIPQTDADRAAMWDVRKKGVGLLGKMKGNRRPVPFVEDTAVPPAKLAEYIRHFRAILDAEGLRYGMFGHIDVGCLHVRPALDLHDPEDAKRLRRISDKVAALAKSYGGILWGEHGTGFRSEYVADYFGPKLFECMCAVKAAFDPTGRLNRGKLTLVPHLGHQFRSIDDHQRARLDDTIGSTAKEHFAEAILCNGNGQCFSTNPKTVMCPSSKVTRDRIHSPKGRAVILRQWLRELGPQSESVVAPLAKREFPADFSPVAGLARWERSRSRATEYDYSHEVYDALDGCLSCKACATQCPIEVDIPNMKAEFLSLYHERYMRPLRDFMLASLEAVLMWFGRFPRFLNAMLGGALTRWFLHRVVGLVDLPKLGTKTVLEGYAERDLPQFDYKSLRRLSAKERAKVVLVVQDAFTTFFEPNVVLTSLDLLTELGFRPILLPFFPNGKALHVKGFLRTFVNLVRRNVDELKRVASLGISIVGIEPAVTLTYRDEYPRSLGLGELPFRVSLLQEWLREQSAVIRERVSKCEQKPIEPATYTLFGHCTEKTASPPSQAAWQQVFADFGLKLAIADVGCCGMCGVYGHEKQHAQDSKGIFAMSWEPRLELAKTQGESVVVAGFSCRHQVSRFSQQRTDHPVFALLAAIQGSNRRDS